MTNNNPKNDTNQNDYLVEVKDEKMVPVPTTFIGKIFTKTRGSR